MKNFSLYLTLPLLWISKETLLFIIRPWIRNLKCRWQILWISYHCSFLQYWIVKNTTILHKGTMTANGGIMFYSLEFYLTHKFQKKINMYRPIFSDYCAGMAYWGKIWQIAIFLFLKAYDDRGSANEARPWRISDKLRILWFLGFYNSNDSMME